MKFIPNYDESKVPEYTLPDPLIRGDGERVTTADVWFAKRRPELLRLFETHVYGRTLAGRFESMHWKETSRKTDALGGKATRTEISVWFTDGENEPRMDILLYVPNNADGPAPGFLGLNFWGNHSITDEPDVALNQHWMRSSEQWHIVDHRATEDCRGVRKSLWPVERLIDRGFALATIYYGDLDPDYDDGFQNGVHPLFYADGQTEPAPDEWASIGVWAWGLSRAVDVLEEMDSIDATKLGVMGHSRLGKTALWAGAQDERIALTIPNNSAAGGATIARRRFGATTKRMNDEFPYWLCENYKNFNDKEDELPVDQHELVALVAPRPVYIASGAEDLWSDPKGEFLSGYHASPVYELLGADPISVDEWPGIHEPVTSVIGYHLRAGGHGVTDYDWDRWMDHMEKWVL